MKLLNELQKNAISLLLRFLNLQFFLFTDLAVYKGAAEFFNKVKEQIKVNVSTKQFEQIEQKFTHASEAQQINHLVQQMNLSASNQ
jgi:hypothetical protein